ncbi:MAG: hypothetical protein ACXWDI_11975 [Nocardioides sp.]
MPASFYAFYMAGLGRMMPFELTQLVLLVVGAGLTVIGARLGPETVSVHLDRVTTTSPPLSAEETSAGRA